MDSKKQVTTTKGAIAAADDPAFNSHSNPTIDNIIDEDKDKDTNERRSNGNNGNGMTATAEQPLDSSKLFLPVIKSSGNTPARTKSTDFNNARKQNRSGRAAGTSRNSSRVSTSNGSKGMNMFRTITDSTRVARSKRTSSLEMRKLPVNVLLRPDIPLFDEELSLDEEDNGDDGISRTFLQRTCLNSKYTLRSQMMFSFGVISTCTILSVVIVCIAVSVISGEVIKNRTTETLDDLSSLLEGRAARYIAEELTPRLIMDDVVNLVHEVTRDRFSGYPMYEDDSKVPFFDTISGANKYPVLHEPLPLEWQIEKNVNDDNYKEHVQGRWPLYAAYAGISTANGVYVMPGSCDPSETDPNSAVYWENCTAANNDLTTGGITPSPTNEQVHRKSSDLIPALKALYEYHQGLTHVSVGMVNGGVGAFTNYPGFQTAPSSNYISVGCDHLKISHPRNSSRRLMSDADIARCESGGVRTAGASIDSRMYTPVDRGWFAESVRKTDKIVTIGPFQNALVGNPDWVMDATRTIFDRVTDEFIGVVSVAFGLDSIRDTLGKAKVTPNSHVSIVRWEEKGTVIASTAWNASSATSTVSISTIDAGLSKSEYAALLNLVDYDSVWVPAEVQERYENYLVDESKYAVKGYPMPPPPAQYSATYEPEFLVIVSVWKPDALTYAREVENNVDKRVKVLIILSISVGLVGWVVVITMLFVVSHFITLPLRQMNEIATRIIDNFGGSGESKIAVEDADIGSHRRFVKTELSEIVQEFQKMVTKFSGGDMAKSAKVDATEVENQFQLVGKFDELYLSRQESSFKYNFESQPQGSQDNDDALDNLARIHHGSNLPSFSAALSVCSSSNGMLKRSLGDACSSPLFKWIILLIVLPLLFSTVTISAIVTANVSRELPGMINIAETGLVNLQVATLEIFAGLRAGFISKHSEQAVRDDYLQTRYASWLLFGGLKTSETMPRMLSATEECKVYVEPYECPVYTEIQVCDCAWGDDNACFNYPTDSRYMQVNYFAASSQDLEIDGVRLGTSYPNVSTSSSTTAWFDDALGADVPGSPNSTFLPTSSPGSSTRLYETTYDRLRLLAATPILQPLYNYVKEKDTVLTKMFSIEADGMIVGYNGCDNANHVTSAHFISNEENGAAELRPELCPLGKFGYDPRCRGWYASGKKLWLSEKSPVSVTPPYEFASRGKVAQTVTSPLVDPNTNEHVGQTLHDFLATNTYDTLNESRTPLAKGGFPILITMKPDAFGADTVAGPGFSLTDPSLQIEQLIVATDELCEETGDTCGLAAVLASMRAGNRSRGTYITEDPEDGSPVTMHIAYAPVNVLGLRQVNSSDFSSGVESVEYELYSLALIEPEASMRNEFEQTEDDIETLTRVGLAILCALIVLAACAVVFLSHRITVSVTEPMYNLLEMIRQINRLDVGEDPPEDELSSGYGSVEVLNVRITMERLYRIIQCANAAYFAGEVEVAFEVFKDALHLFTRLDNRKAMGIANNNLGNTMLTLYRTAEVAGDESIAGMSKRQIIGQGMAYFHQAIQLGEKAYDDFYEAEGWSPKCLHFMQHLSNRYFNRAMFLLVVKDAHERPKEIMELGLRDLQIARDMDVEIVDEGTQVGWGIRGAEAHFEVLLCRIRGHVTLLEKGYPDDWEVDEMIENMFKLVKVESKKDTSDLFTGLGLAGRMQQAEFELMRYEMVKKNISAAAKIAIRMLVEDDFIIIDAQGLAVDVLLEYCKSENASDDVQAQLEIYQAWLALACDSVDASSKGTERMSVLMKAGSMARGLSKKSLESIRNIDENNDRRMSHRESLRGDITMEKF